MGNCCWRGKPNFLETVVVEDWTTRRELANWLWAGGRNVGWRSGFLDAEVAEAVDAILFIGMAPHWYPPNYDYGACWYATCAGSLSFSRSGNTARRPGCRRSQVVKFVSGWRNSNQPSSTTAAPRTSPPRTSQG